MKNFILTLTIVAFTIMLNAQTLPFSEDFTGGTIPTNWENTDSISSGSLWQANTSQTITTSTGETGFMHFRGTWNVDEQHYNANSSHLITPTIDASANSNVTLKFETELYLEGSTVLIQVSNDNGISYSVVDQLTTNHWPSETHEYDISAIAAGNSQVKVAFSVISGPTSSNPDLRLDDIYIYEEVANDVGITEWLTPVSDCGLGANENISVIVKNWGQNVTSENIMLSFSLDDGSSFSSPELFPNSLQIAESDTFTFSNTADFSAVQSYNCIVKVEMTGDGIETNNELAQNIVKTQIITSFPYYQDFESGPEDWYSSEAASSWELGTPNSDNLTEAASGVNCWATNLDGHYLEQELSWVYSPCYDFTSLTNPILSMDVWYNMQMGYLAENISANVQVSIDGDCDTCWHVIGSVGTGENWYNTIYGWSNISNGWETAVLNLDTLAGESQVRFRVEMKNPNGSTREGFAFDNFEIFNQSAIDVLVSEFSIYNQPNASCGFDANEMIKIRIFNNGTNEVTADIPVRYSINGGIDWAEETFINTNSIMPGEDAQFIFTANFADLSSNAIYNCIAETNLSTDERPENDEILTTIVSKPLIDNFPYLEDFETSSADFWITGADGASNDWQFGIPAGVTINAAYSGSHAWVTQLNGDYHEFQESYVESPCFDLSNIDFPVLSFQMFADLRSGDFLRIMYSTDGIFWYILNETNGTDQEWENLNQTLIDLEGESSVSFRFYLISNGTYGAEGIALDDIGIFSDEGIYLNTNNLESQKSIKLFPNPTSHSLSIHGLEGDSDKIEIVDLTGKIVKQVTIARKNLTIDVSSLQNGVYFVKIDNKMYKLIKQ